MNVPAGKALIQAKSLMSDKLSSIIKPKKQGSEGTVFIGSGVKATVGGQLYINQETPGS